jgi:thiol-disulfide isomerase/thioredoxin
VLLLAALASGCSSPAPRDTTYTFKADDSPVKVDTPALRALKASADIAPCPAVGTTPATAHSELPNATLPCLGGGHSVDLGALRGPLLLNYWAQNCGPCKEESPILQGFSHTANGKVSVIGVDFQDVRPGLALQFAKALGVTYPQLADPDGGTRAALHIAALPITLLIDGSGEIAYTQVGPVKSEADLAALVQEHLGVSVPVGAGS